MPRRSLSTCKDQNNDQFHRTVLFYAENYVSNLNFGIFLSATSVSSWLSTSVVCFVLQKDEWADTLTWWRKRDDSFEALKTWLYHLLMLWPSNIPANVFNINFINCKNGHTVYLLWLLWKLSKIIYIKCLAQIPEHNMWALWGNPLLCLLGSTSSHWW